MLWTSEDAAAATGGRTTRDWNAAGVSIDSRSVAPDDLFIALAGPKFDGHDYVADALKTGAAAALVARAPDELLRVLRRRGQAADAVAGDAGVTGRAEEAQPRAARATPERPAERVLAPA
jgi:UDP-N-acetylmuramyl pentapeptide synthase